jgi:hypothetical protein
MIFIEKKYKPFIMPGKASYPNKEILNHVYGKMLYLYSG